VLIVQAVILFMLWFLPRVSVAQHSVLIRARSTVVVVLYTMPICPTVHQSHAGGPFM